MYRNEKEIKMKIQFVYIAGPMSKGPLLQHVRDAIDTATKLCAAGLYPFVPQLSILWQLMSEREYEDWLRYDFAWIGKCDAVLRLPGDSDGADREVAHAQSNNIPVFYSVEELFIYIANQELDPTLMSRPQG